VQVGPELEALIQREFDGGASLQRALELVHLGGGIQAARRLARQEADLVGPDLGIGEIALESVLASTNCP
jgi:geranylgeranyl pyrophosphate synthase